MGRPGLWLWMKATLLGERPGIVCWEGVFTNGCGDMWRGEACLQRWRRRVQGQDWPFVKFAVGALRRPKG